MRLDCPKCGAKGYSRRTKTPKWRCSPAPSNGGCGFEWDDPEYNNPKKLRHVITEGLLDWPKPPQPPPAAPVPSPPPPAAQVPAPGPRTDGSVTEGIKGLLQIGAFILFVVIVIGSIVIWGAPEGGWGDDDGYKEECRTEERAGRIREVCW